MTIFEGKEIGTEGDHAITEGTSSTVAFDVPELQDKSASNDNANNDVSPLYTAMGGITGVSGLAVDVTNVQIKSGAVFATKAGAKGVKLLGRGVTGVDLVMSYVQFVNSDGKPSDYARLSGAVVITSSAAIPTAGPYISFGLGTADAAGALMIFINHSISRVYLRCILI